MKKIFISFLVMTLTLTNISLINIPSVQAATTDNAVTTTENTIKISLDNIRDIVIENNLDLKIADNNLKIAKEKRDDAKETFENESEPDESNFTTTTTDNLGNATTTVDTAAYNKAVSTYNTDKSNYETAKENYKKAKTTYDQQVESKVSDVQNAYITYLTDLSTKKLKEDTVKYNEKKEKVYKLQYESGFISKNKYTSLLQGNTSVNDANASNDTEELDKIKLCNELGISPEENITINTDIIEDFQVISKINYEDDLSQMLDNNIEIKNQNEAIDDLDDAEDDYTNEDIYDYNVDNAEITLKKLLKDKETSFKEKYNDLMASYNSIKSDYDVINQKQKEYQINQIKYDYGFVSKIGEGGVDTEKLTLDEANAKFIQARNQCYLKYLKYIEMKEGY